MYLYERIYFQVNEKTCGQRQMKSNAQVSGHENDLSISYLSVRIYVYLKMAVGKYGCPIKRFYGRGQKDVCNEKPKTISRRCPKKCLATKVIKLLKKVRF
jgi:hypothetical protein